MTTNTLPRLRCLTCQRLTSLRIGTLKQCLDCYRENRDNIYIPRIPAGKRMLRLPPEQFR